MLVLRAVSRAFWPLTVVLALAGCASEQSQARQYELQGQILSIRPEANEVLIKHGDIRNFMPGMTMPFRVRDAALLAGKAPGDLVTAQLMVAETEAWLATLEKTGTAPLDAATSMPAASFVSPLEPGDSAPTATLTGQDGQPLPLEWAGSATAITFIYVRCPLPQFCPMMDRRFAEIQKALKSDPRLEARARLLSVSFDPQNDTPAALRAHASKLGADPAIWRFATAPPEIVDRFAAAFGVNVIREPDGTITHNLRTAVIDPDGRAVSVYDGSDWTSDQVIDDLRRSLATQ
ncbi:MAG: SCO family protein [Dongiaceae bacterium]